MDPHNVSFKSVWELLSKMWRVETSQQLEQFSGFQRIYWGVVQAAGTILSLKEALVTSGPIWTSSPSKE